MTIEEKIKDLIIQATTDRSHAYVKSVCEEALKEISILKAQLDRCGEQRDHAVNQTWTMTAKYICRLNNDLDQIRRDMESK